MPGNESRAFVVLKAGTGPCPTKTQAQNAFPVLEVVVEQRMPLGMCKMLSPWLRRQLVFYNRATYPYPQSVINWS